MINFIQIVCTSVNCWRTFNVVNGSPLSYATLSLIKFNFYELCILQRFPPKRKLTDLFAKDVGQHVFFMNCLSMKKIAASEKC